jgi:hypothetical protein
MTPSTVSGLLQSCEREHKFIIFSVFHFLFLDVIMFYFTPLLILFFYLFSSFAALGDRLICLVVKPAANKEILEVYTEVNFNIGRSCSQSSIIRDGGDVLLRDALGYTYGHVIGSSSVYF